MNHNFHIKLKLTRKVWREDLKTCLGRDLLASIISYQPVISANTLIFFPCVFCYVSVLFSVMITMLYISVSVFCIHRKSYVWINIIFPQKSESFDVCYTRIPFNYNVSWCHFMSVLALVKFLKTQKAFSEISF